MDQIFNSPLDLWIKIAFPFHFKERDNARSKGKNFFFHMRNYLCVLIIEKGDQRLYFSVFQMGMIIGDGR